MAARTQLSPSVLLLDGQTALRQGQKQQAQVLFYAVLDIDPHNEEALLWLSGTLEPHEALQCLQQVLLINPDNEQAQEGISWLHQTYAIDAVSTEQANIEVQGVAGAVERYEPRVSAATERAVIGDVHPLSGLLDAASHVAMVGALLGLISLAAALRANALFVGRGEGGPLSWGGAIALACTAAITHGLGFVLAWWLLGSRLAMLRNDHRGDHFLSLIEASRALQPGYLAAPALGLVLLGVGWSEQRWIPIVVVVITLLAGALLWSGQRILKLRGPLRMSHLHERRQLMSLLGPALAGGGIALVVASLLVRFLIPRL